MRRCFGFRLLFDERKYRACIRSPFQCERARINQTRATSDLLQSLLWARREISRRRKGCTYESAAQSTPERTRLRGGFGHDDGLRKEKLKYVNTGRTGDWTMDVEQHGYGKWYNK